jgi:hypothetical protein
MSGIRTKVRLNIVPIRVSRTNGIGRRNHSITLFKVASEVVPVKIAHTKIIKIIRQPKHKPERNPSQVRPGIGIPDIGAPGMLIEWTMTTIMIKNRKYLISVSNFLTGNPAPISVINKTQVRIDRSITLTVAVMVMLKQIVQINLIRPSSI